MRKSSRLVNILIIVGFAIFFWPEQASAYLDPQTGTIILQAIVGALIGAVVAVRTYWSKIKSFFSKKKPDLTNSDPSANLLESNQKEES